MYYDELSQNTGEIKSREVELGSKSRMDCLAAELFLNSCFSDTVFLTLLRTAVETAISGVHECSFFSVVFFNNLKKIKKYNTIIEQVSTPVPTVDNIHIQIYAYMLCIHNRQKDTSIQTKSWTKYFIDRYLPCTMSY